MYQGESVSGEERRRPIYPDAQQVFVGNLPPNVSEDDLKSEFSRFGKIVDVRINIANKMKQANTNKFVPNFGFVIFEDEASVENCLKAKPITYEGHHRLNVEEKKARNPMGNMGGRPSLGGGRGGSNYYRGGRGGMAYNNRENTRGGASFRGYGGEQRGAQRR